MDVIIVQSLTDSNSFRKSPPYFIGGGGGGGGSSVQKRINYLTYTLCNRKK